MNAKIHKPLINCFVLVFDSNIFFTCSRNNFINQGLTMVWSRRMILVSMFLLPSLQVVLRFSSFRSYYFREWVVIYTQLGFLFSCSVIVSWVVTAPLFIPHKASPWIARSVITYWSACLVSPLPVVYHKTCLELFSKILFSIFDVGVLDSIIISQRIYFKQQASLTDLLINQLRIKIQSNQVIFYK